MSQPTLKHQILKGLGFVFVGLGFIGIFLPLVPTTPFLLLALACFARSSPQVHSWLINHKVLGPYVRDWERDRAIPLKAKIIALVMMSASFAWLLLGTNAPAIAIWMTGGILSLVAIFIVTRPSGKTDQS